LQTRRLTSRGRLGDGAGKLPLIAVEDEAILAIGAVRDFGEITLNYVAPEARSAVPVRRC
jgi:hypothetical protein